MSDIEENDARPNRTRTPNSQSRRWCGTLNNYDPSLKEPPLWLKDLCEGIVWGREVGEAGTPHIQCYLYLKKRSTLGGLRKHFPAGFSMHLEAAKGNTKQNYDYCTKDGDYTEWGKLPRDGWRKTKEETEDEWQQTWILAVENRHAEITAEKRIKYYATIKNIAADHSTQPQRLDVQPGVWIHGPAGWGKSWSAREDYGGPTYTKDFTKWWPRYNGEPVVILDDIAPEHARTLGDYLKIWGDIYPFNAETKGGYTGYIRPRTFIVTSQYAIHEVFNDTATVDAIARRFRVVTLERSRNPAHLAVDDQVRTEVGDGVQLALG